MNDDRNELDALREGLAKEPSELQIADLLPIFVPTSFVEWGNWPGPFETLAIPGLALTWTVLQPSQTMRYLDNGVQKAWDTLGISWRDRALENLQRHSMPCPWTHEFRRQDSSIFAVAMMYLDGLGPSRVLLRESLEVRFPEGYLVSLPEMSCGLALSVRADTAERAEVEQLAERCFRDGTRPLA